MKSFFAAVIVVLCISCSALAEVEQDTELHRVIGGLYSLAAAVNMNGNTNPHINQLRKYFGNDTPTDWQVTSRVSRAQNAIWVGVPVGRYSSARRFLRSHSQELAILDSPGGYAWLGGDYAWIKAADITGDTLRSVRLLAARGSGEDSEVVFLSTPGQAQWWQASPGFGVNSAKKVAETFGVKDAPELHRPGGVTTNIYDTVKPAEVKTPDKVHYGTRKSSFDMSIEMGDVLFRPIPNIRR